MVEPRQRRPLSNVDGAEERRGDATAAAILADAFTVRDEERDDPVAGVHGLHPYPARLHPAWVRRLLDTLKRDAVVWDPFCGSGTTLVEASLSGRPCIGSDLNEVALRVAFQRTRRYDERFLEAFARSAVRVHEGAAKRRETRFGVLAKGETHFPRHVLGQLISLRDEIEREENPDIREAMLMVGLSPLIGKFAERPGKPAPQVGRRAVRDRFLGRCEQATEAWADYTEAVRPDLPDPNILKADARKTPLHSYIADAVISSPPYPGVYDYTEEQVLRAPWIGTVGWMHDARRAEIGRRNGGRETWGKAMGEVLTEIQRVTRAGAQVFLVVGDGVTNHGSAIRADKVLRTLIHTRKLPFTRIAAVSQERPWFHGGTREAFADRPRREHVIQFERRG